MSRSITRIAAILGTVAVSGSLLAACGDSAGGDSDGLLGAIESGNVTLGTKFDQPGLGLREPDGSMTGLDIDVA
ncbi:MAG: glutamate-binding protein, partial [Corynebacterium casei]